MGRTVREVLNNEIETEPEVLKKGILDMQVCVPETWTDKQVETFAEEKYPCGTTHGWTVRKEGDPALGGDPERNPCAERTGFVHVMLDA